MSLDKITKLYNRFSKADEYPEDAMLTPFFNELKSLNLTQKSIDALLRGVDYFYTRLIIAWLCVGLALFVLGIVLGAIGGV